VGTGGRGEEKETIWNVKGKSEKGFKRREELSEKAKRRKEGITSTQSQNHVIDQISLPQVTNLLCNIFKSARVKVAEKFLPL
jgi:hypothetical protein